MSILDIRVLGDPILRQATTPVATITDGLQRLIDDMFDTMYHARGIGLAAPQVGRSERLAWAAMQQAWQSQAARIPITQVTPPDDVIAFIESQPGLPETCLLYPEYLVEDVPLVVELR